MTYTLAERDGNLYAKRTLINEWVPQEDINWYLLTTPYRRYRAWFASEEAARAFLGKEMHPTCNPPLVFEITQGWRFHRATSGKPEITETTPIRCPVHRGRNSLVWHKGAWYKETAKGLVKLVAQEAVVK